MKYAILSQLKMNIIVRQLHGYNLCNLQALLFKSFTMFKKFDKNFKVIILIKKL